MREIDAESAVNETVEADSSAPARRSKIIAFCSARGGAGKTTLLLSAATLLARAGKKVLIIDADFSTRGLTSILVSKFNIIPDHENTLVQWIQNLEGNELKYSKAEPTAIAYAAAANLVPIPAFGPAWDTPSTSEVGQTGTMTPKQFNVNVVLNSSVKLIEAPEEILLQRLQDLRIGGKKFKPQAGADTASPDDKSQFPGQTDSVAHSRAVYYLLLLVSVQPLF